MTSILLCAAVLTFDEGEFGLATMAYGLGISMSATLVAVRKAYAGNYSTLLAMQKVAEASLVWVARGRRLVDRPLADIPGHSDCRVRGAGHDVRTHCAFGGGHLSLWYGQPTRTP